jgi:hypothetical protein
MKVQIDKSGNILAWGIDLKGKDIIEAELPEKFDEYFSKYIWNGEAITLKEGESIPNENTVGVALNAVMQATPEELEEIKKILGI